MSKSRRAPASSQRPTAASSLAATVAAVVELGERAELAILDQCDARRHEFYSDDLDDELALRREHDLPNS